MSILSALTDNRVYSFEQVFGVKDRTTREMQNAVRDWYGLYYGCPKEGEDPCQRLPAAIVTKLAKAVFGEYAAGTDKAGAKGRYVARVLAALNQARQKAVQEAFVGGACFLKPVFTPGGPCFGVIGRRNYLVLGRDMTGRVTDIGTAETTETGGFFYTLLERRTVDGAGYLTIESRLYRSDTRDVLGTEAPLAALPGYAALERLNRLPKPVGSLGLVPVEVPMVNCVDGSPDPVSVYAPAAGLIHQVNVNEAQLAGEFERGESRIIVSSDLMERDEHGKRTFKDHVFAGVNDDPEIVGVTIFSPALREQSFLARKDHYLRCIESVIGLQRGLLSQVEAVERTATEITSSKGDYALTVTALQGMWEGAVREAVRVCDVLGQMYGVCDGASVDLDKDVRISWGDGVLYDRDKAAQEMMQQVQAGILAPERFLGWYYELPCDTPADREKIRAAYMPEMQELLTGE